MANESKTMNLFRSLLKSKGYYDDPTITIEEQTSDDKKIKRLLSYASKANNGNEGHPDFIITSSRYPDFLIVVECKAEIKKHESDTRDSYKDYAVDGALFYASFLSRE